MSSTSSMPMESRTSPSVMPSAARSASLSLPWMVDPVWIASVRTSPMCVIWLTSRSPSRNVRAASLPPASSIDTIEPAPVGSSRATRSACPSSTPG